MNEFSPIPGTTILAFGHKARHGKDTCAMMVHEAFPRLTKIYSFAGALKAYCRAVRGMTKKDGALLQRVGTDELRAVDPNIWVRALYWQLDEERPVVALMADLRFPNEMQFVHQLGGWCAKVTRLNADGSLYVVEDRDPLHESEVALDGAWPWDRYISARSGEMETLVAQTHQVFCEFLTETTKQSIQALSKVA